MLKRLKIALTLGIKHRCLFDSDVKIDKHFSVTHLTCRCGKQVAYSTNYLSRGSAA